MAVPAIFYIPRLHPEFVPEDLRARVFFVPSGLAMPSAVCPGGQTVAAEGDDPRETVRRALPFGPAESRAVLEEILRLGMEHASDGLLGQLAALQRPDPRAREDRAEESAALEAFASSGRLPASTARKAAGQAEEGASPGKMTQRQILADCQKLLLLAHALEEDILDSARLEGLLTRAEESLYAALGEGDADDLQGFMQQPGLADGDTVGTPPVPVAWRLMAEAVFPFLPDNALLLTADSEMTQDLDDAGLLSPFPEDRANILLPDWPRELASTVAWARLPAWRLTGRRSCPPDRPWLGREHDLLVAQAREKGAGDPVEAGKGRA